MISVDLGVFEEISGFDAVGEVGAVEEMVVTAIHFALARSAGGAGDGVVGFLFVSKPTAKGCFSGARRPGDEEKNTGAAHGRENDLF